MSSDFRSSRSGVFVRVLGSLTFAALLFAAGCTSNGSGNKSGPTAPSLSGAVSPVANVSPGQTGASYSITVSNAAGAAATSGMVTVTDPPTNFTVTAITGNGWTCTLSSLTCTRSDSLAAGASFPVITVTGNVTGSAGQTISIPITITGGGLTTGVTSTPSVPIVSAPTISKAFNPTSIGLNANSTLTFTVTNPTANTVAQSGLAFTDTLPSGLVVATQNGLVDNCGGTATATAGSGSISLTGGSVAANSNCTVIVNVTGATVGAFTNTSGAVSSTNGGTGNTATANLTVVGFPTISQAFGATSILLNASASLTFTITNPSANAAALTGVAFTDTLPAGLVVASPNALVDNCGGTATAVATSGAISLTGGTVAASGSCTITLNVTGTSAGSKVNVTGAISSTQSGTGSASNSATLNVIAAPSISKAYGATGVAVNGTTTLTFTLTNPVANTVALNGVAFSDTFPAGTVVASPNALMDNCGGTATATAGSGSVSLAGATLATGASCTLAVKVTATAAGTFVNTTSAVSSTNGGTGNTGTATLNAEAAPTISKSFNPTTIPLNGTTSLGFTITNPVTNTVALTGVGFTDTLQAGLTAAASTSTVCGGTLTTSASAVSLSGATVALNSPCTFNVTVTGTAAGSINNTTGAVSSTQSGAGSISNTAILNVVAPPTISKNFGAATVPLNTSTSLSFTLTNPNTSSSLSGVAFTDPLPTGMSVSTPNGLTGSCGSGTITATAGSNSVSLSGGTLGAAGSCTFSVNVTPTVAGANVNTTGKVSSTEGGTGTTASATLSAIGPPSISKAFGSTGVAVNGTTSLTFTITNPNTVTLTGVAFTDNMPTGLVAATTPVTDTCGGTVTVTAGSVSLTGGSVSQSTNCKVTVNVTANAAGSFVNTTGAVSSTNGGTGNTGTATLNAAAAPTISKSFNPTTISLNSTTSLGFTITNPVSNTVALTGVGFTDTLQAGLTAASSTSTVCGGTLTTSASSVSLSGATVAVNSQCTFNVTVTGTAAGSINNTTGAVSSTQSGAGATSNTAILTVIGSPTISKAFGANAITVGGSTSLTFTINNPNPSTSLSGVAFTDTLPAGLAVSSPTNGLTGSCGTGTITATAGSSSISLSGGTLGSGGSCTFGVNVTGNSAGTWNNTTGPISSTEGGTGTTSNTATLAVLATPPTIISLSSNSGPVGSSLTITGTNFGSTQAQGSSTVMVNGAAATPTSWSGTSITVTVPSNATGTGNVVVTVLGHASATSSATAFTVLTCSSCTISGAVTGPLPSGVTITLSGAATGSTQTLTNGTYSFTGLTPGSYVLTPALPGYTFTPPSISINLSGNATGQNFMETSAVTSYSITGMLTYSGTKTGSFRTYIRVYSTTNTCTGNCGGAMAATSLASEPSSTGTSYTVRGLQQGTYYVAAEIDTLNNGVPNASNPYGSYSTVTINSSSPATVSVPSFALQDPSVAPTPMAPAGVSAVPGNTFALVQYNQNNRQGLEDSNGRELALSYRVYYDTFSDFRNNTFYSFAAHGLDDRSFIVRNLGTGTYYFQVSAIVGNVEVKSTSASATLPPAAGGFTFSGTVTFPGTATGPLYVGLFDGKNGKIYGQEIQTPFTSPVAFSVTGVPAGNYQAFAIIDQNNNGLIEPTDISNVNNNHGGPPPLTVSTSNITGYTIALTSAVSTIDVNTYHQQNMSNTPTDTYNLNFGISWGSKRPVAMTLISGPNVAVPWDLPIDTNNSEGVYLNAATPVTGETYQFQVTFSDGTTQTMPVSITVLNSFVTGMTMNSPVAGTQTIPVLNWVAPASPPSPYTYYVGMYSVNSSTNNVQWYDYGGHNSNGIASGTTNIPFNQDGSATNNGSPISSLPTTTNYLWFVGVQDANGDTAEEQSTYNIP